MKKLIVVFVVLTFAFSLFAFSTNFHLGLVSGLGVSKDIGNWQVGADLESSFPIYAFGNGIASKNYEDANFNQSFKTGALAFVGADLYGYRHIYQGTYSNVLVGGNFIFGFETSAKTFEAGIRPSVKYCFNFNDKCSVFAVVGIPVVSIIYAKGFRAPLVRIPRQNYATLLTGCKLGLSINI